MERKVSVYPFPFGTRVFIHRNGVIREAEYRGMRIRDTGICGKNVDTEHIFWFGGKLGEEKFKASMPIYKTAEDAAQETNPVQYEVLNIESFSLRYLPHLVWDGIQFYGWLWDGSRPVNRATREPLRVCKIYGGEVTFVDCSGNEYDAEHFQRFYQTAEQCRAAHKPKIVMLDEEEDDFAKQKRDEYCNNCKDEPMLTDTEGVKCDMENKYRQFCKVQKKKPDYAECQIIWKEDGKGERVRIKLSQNVDEATDDTIFFYCNGLEELKSLAEFDGEDFIVTDFWEFY